MTGINDLYAALDGLRQALEAAGTLSKYAEEMSDNTDALFSIYGERRMRELIEPYKVRFTRASNVIASSILVKGSMIEDDVEATRVENEAIEAIFYVVCEGYLLGHYDRGQEVLSGIRVSLDQESGQHE